MPVVQTSSAGTNGEAQRSRGATFESLSACGESVSSVRVEMVQDGDDGACG